MRRRSLLLLALTSCQPDFDVRNSEVRGPRVLAVSAEPAEARPGARVDYRALVAEGDPSELRFTYCTAPKPLDTNAAVGADCLEEAGIRLASEHDRAWGDLPLEGCSRFGPDPPPGDARARDPDASGGYYQPLRIDAFDEAFVHLQRVSCNPSNVPSDVAREFSMQYTPNRNPSILDFETATDAAVAPGSTVELALLFDVDDAESYVVLLPGTSRIEARRETLRIAWFANQGALAFDQTLPPLEAPGRGTNRWVAPEVAGSARLWAILHDDRGGTAFAALTLEVR